MDLGFLVLVSEKQDLRKDAVRPSIVVVDVEGRLDFPQRVVHGRLRLEECVADDRPGDVGMGASIVRVERDRTPKALSRLGQIVLVETPPLLVAQQDQVIRSYVRSLLAYGDISASVFQPTRQGRDNRPGDFILDDKDILKLAV